MECSPDRPAWYRIHVLGRLDESRFDRPGELTVSYGVTREGPQVTALSGVMDQAGLRGLLRRLWDLNLTLLSVSREENDG